MTNYDELIAAYDVDVRFPDVSGMEHLDMLLTRSEIARGERYLTTEQRARLAEADRVLLQHARRFYQAIQRIADLQVWRRSENVPLWTWRTIAASPSTTTISTTTPPPTMATDKFNT